LPGQYWNFNQSNTTFTKPKRCESEFPWGTGIGDFDVTLFFPVLIFVFYVDIHKYDNHSKQQKEISHCNPPNDMANTSFNSILV